MGRAKEYAMAESAQGFSSRKTHVCSNCIEDYALRAYINSLGQVNSDFRCSYCEQDRQGANAIAFDDFVRHVLDGVAWAWSDVNSEALSWREGEWSTTVWDAYDLFDDESQIGFCNDGLLDDVRDSLVDRQWCQKNPYELTVHQALIVGWEEFTRVIKHESRYVFLRREDDRARWRGTEEIPPADFLDALGHAIDRCQLYTTLAAGAELCRIRTHKPNEKFDKARDIGSPPPEYAKTANRMTAAGISAFYGAFARETAVLETASGLVESAWGTLGRFRVIRDLRLVDFTKLPDTPSIFDAERRGMLPGLRFLSGFLTDFTAPIVKDGREHIEYVPTQVVAEYLRFIHHDGDGRPIDGILYKSARHDGAHACVLFVGPEGACDSGEETPDSALVLLSSETFELPFDPPKDSAVT